MTRATTPAQMLARGLCAGGLACLAVITLASPGATRMFAWPWTLTHAGALLAPALALVARAFDRHRPLLLPSLDWCVVITSFAGVVGTSALFSPDRGPSVLWSAPLLSGAAAFFVLVDWLQGESAGSRRERLTQAALITSVLVAVASLALWASQLPDAGHWLDARNPFPLGHSNYTAGLALLMIPVSAATVLRQRGAWRWLAITVVALALAMLFTSGSRGGFFGLAALALASLWQAPLSAKKKWLLAATAALATLLFALAHPRTRTTLFGGADGHLIAASEKQRAAMFTAGWRMGADRPLLGWGPGTTPLVYPKYRGSLEGGAENVLQLHSWPAHVWAELGATGLACLLAFTGLILRDAARDATAAVALLGYGAFALTDWQLDVPIFACAIATFAALLAPPAQCNLMGYNKESRPRRSVGWLVGLLALGGVALVSFVGRTDPTPELNVRALTLGRDPAQADRAITLLRASLALHPDQEIAHFNLGWLLVVRDPAAAEKHFGAAAHLVPDKGGVYFGLGLARLNQGRSAAAARAFALEGLNDPQFLASPWWREPAIAATRDASAAAFADLLRQIAPSAPPHSLSASLLGRVPAGPERVYRRERTGYPVLMRNLDLPTPLDLYDVRESAAPASTDAAASLPPKGWLPSPLLLKLLAGPVPLKP
jgi:O-antigen ligase